MGRHSRRSRRGGDKIDDIQSQLDSIQQQVNELKSSSSSSMTEESVVESMPEPFFFTVPAALSNAEKSIPLSFLG